MLERSADLEIEKVYETLKGTLLQKSSRLLGEEPPTFISVAQGSLWGVSPRTAKKVVSYRLSREGSGTRIVASSRLSSDWKNLTIIGCALSVVVASLCWWIAADLENLASQQPSYWSWIIMNGDFTNFELAQAFVGLTRGLAVFLIVIVVLEVIIYWYAKSRIDGFAEETLKPLF